MNKFDSFNAELMNHLNDIEDASCILIDECENDNNLAAKITYQSKIESLLNKTLKSIHMLHNEYEENYEDYLCNDEPAKLNINQLLR